MRFVLLLDQRFFFLRTDDDIFNPTYNMILYRNIYGKKFNFFVIIYENISRRFKSVADI